MAQGTDPVKRVRAVVRLGVACGVMVCGCLTGCSSLIRGMIDTQPRVEIDPGVIEDPAAIVHGAVVVYEPTSVVSESADVEAMLREHAPVIVQGVHQGSAVSSRYDAHSDALGAPHLAPGGDAVRIETSEPRVYGRVEHAQIRGAEFTQLVYAFWYPSHPVGAVESGAVDGGVVRITLDARGEPAVFEYTQPCGCFHGVFVSQTLEDGAHREFGAIAPHRVDAVEPALTGSDDWVVRDIVDVVPGATMVLYVSAGKHACEAVRFLDGVDVRALAGTRVAYGLDAYEALDRVERDGGGVGSIFDEHGLVLGAKRGAEEVVFSDLDHAGWPRRLDTMRIHWDADLWTDPTLLETHLRLPSPFAGGAASTPVGTLATTATPGTATANVADAEAEQVEYGSRLVLFTNGHCTGCQETKRFMADSASVRAALQGWTVRIVDTLTSEGELLAAKARVSSVPVLIGYRDGQEVFRDKDVDSPEKIVRVIRSHSVPARTADAGR